MINFENQINQIVKKYYGYERLRPGQEEIIMSLLSGQDALAVMPTGAGKSLCYQIPALCMDKMTLVVSPLISLMEDQVLGLCANGISAAYLNSSQSMKDYRETIQKAKEGAYTLLYVAPERLLTESFLSFAMEAEISLLAVDEAHCISQWGQDFRPSYREIPTFIRKLSKRPVIGAFTATATQLVKEDISLNLSLHQPRLVVTGFDRPNLYFSVVEKHKVKEKEEAIISYLKEHGEESGIIYCSTRKQVEQLYDLLKTKGFLVGKYHGGMTNKERTENQRKFSYDEVKLMVASNAFGMGKFKSGRHKNCPKK